jgi:hypothetical protein
MPAAVEVHWVNQHGTNYSRTVSLELALREATGGAREALVFEIGPAGEVTVQREYSGDNGE